MSRAQPVGPASCGASRTGTLNTPAYEERGEEVGHFEWCEQHIGGIKVWHGYVLSDLGRLLEH